MTWAEYQLWETETRAAISDAARRARVSGGGGVSVDKGRVTVRRAAGQGDAPRSNRRGYPLLRVTRTRDTGETVVGDVLLNYDGSLVNYFASNLLESGILSWDFQSSGKILDGARERYVYLFPLRVVVGRFNFTGEPGEIVREVLLQSWTLNLKREKQRLIFEPNPHDSSEIVRIISVSKI